MGIRGKQGKGREGLFSCPLVTFPPERKKENAHLPRIDGGVSESNWKRSSLSKDQFLKTSPSLRSFKHKPFSEYSSTFFANCFHHLGLASSPKRNVGLFRSEVSNVIGGRHRLNCER